jgi:hypothetical protein
VSKHTRKASGQSISTSIGNKNRNALDVSSSWLSGRQQDVLQQRLPSGDGRRLFSTDLVRAEPGW